MFKKSVVVAGLTTVAASAMAAVPAGVTTAITEAGTDVATIGGAVLVVIVGLFGFRMLKRAL